MPVDPFGQNQLYSGNSRHQYSEEGSEFSAVGGQWAASSGNAGVSHTFADRLTGLGIATGAGVAAWNLGPKLYNKAVLGKLDPLARRVESKQPWAARRIAGALKSQGAITGTGTDFWYKFARRVENTEVAGPYLSSLFRIFAKASYASEFLSPGANRGTKDYFFDIGRQTIGATARADTLSHLTENLGISRKALENVESLAWKEGKLYTAHSRLAGGERKYTRGKALGGKVSRLWDKGRGSFGALTTLSSWAGLRDPLSGDIRGLKVMGNADYVPMPELTKFQMAKGYSAMALQRTSFLIDDMVGELKKFTEFISPEARKKFFKAGYSIGAIPQFRLGGSATMLGRYATGAGKVFAGLALLNQGGYMAQHGNAVSSVAGGALQGGVLAYAGSRIAGVAGKSRGLGAAIGFGLGLAGGFGIGPFNNGVIPGAAGFMGGLNVVRSKIGEALPIFGNKWRRGIESFAPGATDFTTAIGMGILGGAGYVGLKKAFSTDTVIDGKVRREYLRGLSWSKLEDILKERPATGRTEELRRFNQLSDEAKQGVRAEVAGYIKDLRKKKNLAELENVYGKTGDTYGIKASNLADTLSHRSYEEIRSKVMKEGGHWLTKVDAMIKRAPAPRAIGYASVLGTVGWSVFTGGLGTKERPDEVRAKNRGEILEAVRRGQKWEFGSTPYQGTDILYYRPNWIARARSGASQAGASGDRGMLEEFFLKNFSYKMERDEYYDRPAPITSAAFDGVPFVYPLIKPLADLIKRPKLMHVDEWARVQGDQIQFLEMGTGLEALPDPSLGAISMTAPASPYSYKRLLGKSWQELTSLSGLVGFYGRETLGAVTGRTGFLNDRPELASFSENTDFVSRFYDQHSGGGYMGLPFVSEPIRRFLVDNKVDSFNPIRNEMPSWMPEQLAYGNQYAELRYGEGSHRLPGEGYAAKFRELKGLSSEQYPMLHRLNILGDVAPWSAEYREVKGQVEAGIADGTYDAEDARFYYNYTKAVETRMDKRSYASYMFNNNQYEKTSGIVESIDPNTLTFTVEGSGGRYSLAGLSNEGRDLVAQLNMSYKEAAQQQRRNAKNFASVLRPGMHVNLTLPRSIQAAVDQHGSIKAAVSTGSRNINSTLQSNGGYAREDSVIGSYALTSGSDRAMGRLWEGFSHNIGKATAPLEYLSMFGASPTMKFLGRNRDALEEYEQMHVYGEDIRLWQRPLAHWFAPAARTAAHNWLGINFTPKHIQDQRQVEEYFDKVKYQKYTALASQAESVGDIPMMKHYESISRRSLIGGHGFVDERRFKNIIGGAESRYGLGFARETTPERQQAILEAMPDYKRRAMASQYAQQQMSALGRLQGTGGLGPEGQAYMRRLRALRQDEGFERTNRSTREYARSGEEGESYAAYMRRQEMEEYFSENSMPGVDWIGFNPAVDLEDVKLKYIQAEGKDFHDFSIYPSRADFIHRKPYITDEDVRQVGIQRVALGHARNALAEVNRVMQIPSNGLSYNINSPDRPNNYIDLNVTRHLDYYPSDF